MHNNLILLWTGHHVVMTNFTERFKKMPMITIEEWMKQAELEASLA
jgi:hypothetical protein